MAGESAPLLEGLVLLGGMSALGSVRCHNEHRMLGLGAQSLRQGQSKGWEGQAAGKELAGICVIPEGMAMDISLVESQCEGGLMKWASGKWVLSGQWAFSQNNNYLVWLQFAWVTGM